MRFGDQHRVKSFAGLNPDQEVEMIRQQGIGVQIRDRSDIPGIQGKEITVIPCLKEDISPVNAAVKYMVITARL